MNQIEEFAKNNKWSELIAFVDDKVDIEKISAENLLLRAIASYELFDYFAAYNYALQAFELNDNLAEAAEFLAVLCVKVGRTKESYYYRKLLSILDKSPALSEILTAGIIQDYTDVLKRVEEKPLLKRGSNQEVNREWDMAEHWYRQHIAFEPMDRDGYMCIVRLLMTQERFRAASDTLKGARAIFPLDADLASMLGDLLTTLGEFSAAQACLEWSSELAPFDEKIHLRKIRAMIKNPLVTFDECSIEFNAWQEKHVQEIRGPINPQEYGERQKLRVGFLLKNFDRTRIAPALGKVLAWHDYDEFSFIGYGEGDITFPFNRYFKSSFDSWRDILQTDAMTLRNMIVADQIDILIDLGGVKSSETLRCFKSRMAPVQVLWSENNLSGSLEQIDYIISDRCQDKLSDKHIQMNFSSTFSASRELLDPNFDRKDERKTFGVDADFSHLTYQSVALWARILLHCPDTILLLRSHDFFAQENSRKLIEIFGNFGLAHRVDIIEEEDRRLFYAHCDVVVLPTQLVGSEFVLDALSARKPVVACSVYDQHTSKAIDTLVALDLAENCLADTLEEYVELCSNWINSPDQQTAFAQQAEELITHHDFFNDKKRMEDISKVLKEIWKKAGG